MTENLSLVLRAESCRFRLQQVAQEHKDDTLRGSMARVKHQAVDCSQQLTAVAELTVQLRDQGITIGAPPAAVTDRARKARTGLRQAASKTLRTDDVRQGSERLVGSATSEDLGAARTLVDEMVKQANRAVDRWRRDQLPVSLDEPLVDLPGMSTVLQVRLSRLRDLLLKTVDKQQPEELTRRMEEISSALVQWNQDKADYDDLLRQQNPEVQRFLNAAGSGGAMWSLVTPAVRAWLDDPENAGVVRVVLTS